MDSLRRFSLLSPPCALPPEFYLRRKILTHRHIRYVNIATRVDLYALRMLEHSPYFYCRSLCWQFNNIYSPKLIQNKIDANKCFDSFVECLTIWAARGYDTYRQTSTFAPMAVGRYDRQTATAMVLQILNTRTASFVSKWSNHKQFCALVALRQHEYFLIYHSRLYAIIFLNKEI